MASELYERRASENVSRELIEQNDKSKGALGLFCPRRQLCRASFFDEISKAGSDLGIDLGAAIKPFLPQVIALEPIRGYSIDVWVCGRIGRHGAEVWESRCGFGGVEAQDLGHELGIFLQGNRDLTFGSLS